MKFKEHKDKWLASLSEKERAKYHKWLAKKKKLWMTTSLGLSETLTFNN